jgi:DNA-binding MarR family transcriptional regulator
MNAPNRLAAPATLSDLLLYRLSKLLGTAGAPVIRLCEGRFGITRREWALLALLADGPLHSSALAQRALLDRTRTSRAVGSLVAKGLVSRSVQIGDRRHVRLVLTDAGRALHAQMFPQVVALNHALLACLPASDVAALDGMLERLQAHAEVAVLALDLPKADRRHGGSRSTRPSAAA